jgi:hypothetical protein
MRWRTWLFAALLLPAPLLPGVLAGDNPKAAAGKKGVKITWKKVVVDRAFRSEGVAVADVNKDGKPDIIVGDVWYEAPNWKRHVLRKDPRDPKRDPQPWDPHNYSEAFCVFAGDFNGDGWPDVIVIPFPGKPCYWYENPKGKPGPWKAHLLWHSACNESPQFADLFNNGKRVLIMGAQPMGKENEGEVCWFAPGKDPTKPWEKHSISGPSRPGMVVPGSFRYAHGLGVGDVNGDGRPDVLTTAGWWEQPARDDGRPWKFHPAQLGPDCADMFAHDLDGDGVNDVISSSAHGMGFWWHQQRRGKGDNPGFVRFDLFPTQHEAAKLPKRHNLTPEEMAVFQAVNKARAGQRRAPWRAHPILCERARAAAEAAAKGQKGNGKTDYPGAVRHTVTVRGPLDAASLVKQIFEDKALQGGPLAAPNLEVGVGVARDGDGRCVCVLLLGDRGQFALFGQSHALHLVDINGDGLKDLVTGRRFWAHGPKGDDTPADPAYLYWFEARRGPGGQITFIPRLIDDDSGVGTQFAIADVNGDGLPDVVISNKKGVYVFIQVRTKEE